MRFDVTHDYKIPWPCPHRRVWSESSLLRLVFEVVSNQIRNAPGDGPADFFADVRQAAEWDAGHLPGAVHLENGRLMLPDGPTIPELARIGVRRVSTGGALAFAAYGALAAAGRELLEKGTCGFSAGSLTAEERMAAFGPEEG